MDHINGILSCFVQSVGPLAYVSAATPTGTLSSGTSFLYLADGQAPGDSLSFLQALLS